MKKVLMLMLAFLMLFCIESNAQKKTKVKSYTKKDGTKVRSHERKAKSSKKRKSSYVPKSPFKIKLYARQEELAS